MLMFPETGNISNLLTDEAFVSNGVAYCAAATSTRQVLTIFSAMDVREELGKLGEQD